MCHRPNSWGICDIFEADFKEALPKMKVWLISDLDPEITKLALETLAKIEAPIMDTAQSKEFINSLTKEWSNLQKEMYPRPKIGDFNEHVRTIKECIKKIVEKRKNEVPFNLNTKTVEHEINIDNDMYELFGKLDLLLVKLDLMND